MSDKSHGAQTISAPPVHAGIIGALNACFAKPQKLPDDFCRLLDRLR